MAKAAWEWVRAYATARRLAVFFFLVSLAMTVIAALATVGAVRAEISWRASFAQ